MSRSAEQVVRECIDVWAGHGGVGAIVGALRREGWLRERPTEYQDTKGALDLCRERCATLERDLAAARKERDHAQGEAAAFAAKYLSATSTALLRVVEAHRKLAPLMAEWFRFRREGPPFRWTCHSPRQPEGTITLPCEELCESLDALDALAPPAKKARYEVRQYMLTWGVWDGETGNWRVSGMALRQQQAERIAAVLNETEGA